MSRGALGYPYDGFWASMDTFKVKQRVEGLCSTTLPRVEDHRRCAPLEIANS